jgi:hypothetical protein
MSQIGSDYSSLPIEVHGTVFDPEARVEDVNVADDELIMLEWRIVFDPEDPNGWAFNPVDKKR